MGARGARLAAAAWAGAAAGAPGRGAHLHGDAAVVALARERGARRVGARGRERRVGGSRGGGRRLRRRRRRRRGRIHGALGRVGRRRGGGRGGCGGGCCGRWRGRGGGLGRRGRGLGRGGACGGGEAGGGAVRVGGRRGPPQRAAAEPPAGRDAAPPSGSPPRPSSSRRRASLVHRHPRRGARRMRSSGRRRAPPRPVRRGAAEWRVTRAHRSWGAPSTAWPPPAAPRAAGLARKAACWGCAGPRPWPRPWPPRPPSSCPASLPHDAPALRPQRAVVGRLLGGSATGLRVLRGLSRALRRGTQGWRLSMRKRRGCGPEGRGRAPDRATPPRPSPARCPGRHRPPRAWPSAPQRCAWHGPMARRGAQAWRAGVVAGAGSALRRAACLGRAMADPASGLIQSRPAFNRPRPIFDRFLTNTRDSLLQLPRDCRCRGTAAAGGVIWPRSGAPPRRAARFCSGAAGRGPTGGRGSASNACGRAGSCIQERRGGAKRSCQAAVIRKGDG
jgi:hypothetical protein